MVIDNDKELDKAVEAVASIEKVDEKPKLSPMEEVESNVAEFLKATLNATMQSSRLSKALEEDLINSLPEMKTNEKIALFNLERTSSNDRIGRLLNPVLEAMKEKQSMEVSNKDPAVQVNVSTGNVGSSYDSKIASSVDPKVSTGIDTLWQLVAAAKRKEDEKDKSIEN